MVESKEQNLNDLGSISYVGKQCYYADRVTFDKKFDGTELGVCIEETIFNLHKLPICVFEKSFLGFRWVYKSEIRLTKYE